MEQKILTSGTSEGLNQQIKEKIFEGWIPVGSHQVVTVHSQNRFSGSTHRDTLYSLEYSQTVRKD